MVKTEVITKVSEKVEGIAKKDIELVLATYGEVVKESLVAGEEVPVIGLGKFAVTERAEREALKNPKEPKLGKKIVPAHKAPKFKASGELKELVK